MTTIATRKPRPKKSLFSFTRKRVFDLFTARTPAFDVREIADGIRFEDRAGVKTGERVYIRRKDDAVILGYGAEIGGPISEDYYTDRGQINRRLREIFSEVSGNA